MKSILFDKPDPSVNKTKAQRLIEFMGIKNDITFGEFLKQYQLTALLNNPTVYYNLIQRNITYSTKLYTLIDPWIKDLKKDDFRMRKEYTVKAVFDKPRGKWPEAISDSVYLDSRKFFSTITDQMV